MVQVIGAGFGRTGTASTKAALEHLGYGPCHHMSELFAHPHTVPEWSRAASGGHVHWVRLLAGYASAVDWPSAHFWRELAGAFPTAKVLLTTRDPDGWYDSVAKTIYRQRYPDVAAMPPELRTRFESVPGLREQPRLVEDLIWQGTFHGRFADRAYAIGVYQEHLATVRATIPPERLLEYDVRQGWRPVCDFLGTPVPAAEFPWLDSTRT